MVAKAARGLEEPACRMATRCPQSIKTLRTQANLTSLPFERFQVAGLSEAGVDDSSGDRQGNERSTCNAPNNALDLTPICGMM